MTTTLIYGKSSSYKSLWALDQAMRTAQKNRVLFLTQDPLDEVKQRIRAWSNYHNAFITDNMLVMPLPEETVNLVDYLKGASTSIELIVIDEFSFLLKNTKSNALIKSKQLMGVFRTYAKNVIVVQSIDNLEDLLSAKSLIEGCPEIVHIKVSDQNITLNYQQGLQAGQHYYLLPKVMHLEVGISNLVLLSTT